MAAVQRGHAGLVAVAGAKGAVGLPSCADTGSVAAAAAQSRFLTGRVTRSGQQEHDQDDQGDRGDVDQPDDNRAAAPQGHLEAAKQSVDWSSSEDGQE